MCMYIYIYICTYDITQLTNSFNINGINYFYKAVDNTSRSASGPSSGSFVAQKHWF